MLKVNMNILIVGFGSIGQRHLKNLMDNYPDNKFSVLKYSQNKQVIQNCEIIQNRTIYDYYKDVKFFQDFQNIDLKNINCAFICNDANHHIEISAELIKYDIDLFIEKPIDMNLDKAINFRNSLLHTKSIAVVGYQSQFHPVYLKMKQLISDLEDDINYVEIKWANYLPFYHPYEDYTKRNSGKASLGGGVLLALSHEINTLNTLFPSNKVLYSNLGYSKNFKIDTEDNVFSVLKKNNIKINFTLGYAQVFEERYIKVQTLDKYIIGDYVMNKVTIYGKSGIEEEFQYELERNELFLSELKFFFKCVESRKVEINTVEQSIKDLELVNNIKKMNKNNKEVIYE